MPLSLSATTINAVLASILNGTAFTPTGPLYVQLHTGDPGTAGTANVAGNSTRLSTGTMSTPAAGQSTNNAAINWTAAQVTTSETYSYVSLWTAATGGTFVGAGTMTASAIAAGDLFSIAIGNLTVAIPTST
jgi:hypothetical protein